MPTNLIVLFWLFNINHFFQKYLPKTSVVTNKHTVLDEDNKGSRVRNQQSKVSTLPPTLLLSLSLSLSLLSAPQPLLKAPSRKNRPELYRRGEASVCLSVGLSVCRSIVGCHCKVPPNRNTHSKYQKSNSCDSHPLMMSQTRVPNNRKIPKSISCGSHPVMKSQDHVTQTDNTSPKCHAPPLHPFTGPMHGPACPLSQTQIRPSGTQT